MAEVGGRLVERFANNLAAQLASGGGEAAAAGQAGGEPAESAAASNGAGPGATASGPAPATAAAGGTADGAASIEELNLPVRAYNSLRREGVHTVADLSARSEEQLLAIDNLGPQSLKEIKQKLADRGLTLSTADAASATGGTAGSSTGAGAPSAAGAAGGGAAGRPSPGATAAAGGASAGPAAGPTPLRAARPPDEDAIDLLSVAGFPVLKRALPVAAVLVVVLLFFLRARGRRSAKS